MLVASAVMVGLGAGLGATKGLAISAGIILLVLRDSNLLNGFTILWIGTEAQRPGPDSLAASG